LTLITQVNVLSAMLKEDSGLVESTPPERDALALLQQTFDDMVEDCTSGTVSYASDEFRMEFVNQFRELGNSSSEPVSAGAIPFSDITEWLNRVFTGDYTRGKVTAMKELAAATKKANEEARVAANLAELAEKEVIWAANRAAEDAAREAEAGIMDDMDFYGDEDAAEEPAKAEAPKVEAKPVVEEPKEEAKPAPKEEKPVAAEGEQKRGGRGGRGDWVDRGNGDRRGGNRGRGDWVDRGNGERRGGNRGGDRPWVDRGDRRGGRGGDRGGRSSKQKVDEDGFEVVQDKTESKPRGRGGYRGDRGDRRGGDRGDRGDRRGGRGGERGDRGDRGDRGRGGDRPQT